MLQQYLPLAVLKLYLLFFFIDSHFELQQYLPLAVLKRTISAGLPLSWKVATVLTACGIETLAVIVTVTRPVFSSLQQYLPLAVLKLFYCFPEFFIEFWSCNSTYRLRYWNTDTNCHNYHTLYLVATVLTACGIETPCNVYSTISAFSQSVATVLTACGIETTL